MKVYDCFTFYNEFELLELRLKSLWDVVDYFVLVEADRTQTNIPKPFYFNERQSEFAEFMPKIRHLMGHVDLPYKGRGDWQIEHAQRNGIAEGLKDAEPDDLIFISDVDEIWAPDILQRINNRQAPLIVGYIPPQPYNKVVIPCQLMVNAIDLLEICPLAVIQKLHVYYFDWISKFEWHGTVLTRHKNLTTPQNMRDLRDILPRIPNGGRHFTSMGGIDTVFRKISTNVEGYYLAALDSRFLDKEYLRNYVKKSMLNGEDLLRRPDFACVLCDVNQIEMPYLQEFVKKYPHFLLKHALDSEQDS